MAPAATNTTISNPTFPLPYETPSNLKKLPVSLPQCKTLLSSSELESIAKPLVETLTDLRLEYFTEAVSPIWRDAFGLTGTLRTFYTAKSIIKAWKTTATSRQVSNISIIPGSVELRLFGPDGTGWVDAGFTFQCNSGPRTDCSGGISIVPDSQGEWKIWMIRTVLEQLTDCPSVDHLAPTSDGDREITGALQAAPSANGQHVNGTVLGTDSNLDDDTGDAKASSTTVLIIGCGQAGLALSSRLLALKVPHLLVDRHPTIGSCWSTRYTSAKLHTVREYSHLPMDRTFTPPEYKDEWMTKDDLAKGYSDWAHKFGIDKNCLLSSEVIGGSYDDKANTWTVSVLKTDKHQQLEIKCRHVALCTGAGGQIPFAPYIPNRDLFKGLALHSSTYTSPSAWTGRKGLVIGTANTAHDIAMDMLTSHLSSVTMLQRRRTYVLPTEYFSRIASKSYSPSVPTEVADRASYSMPYAVTRLLALKAMHAFAKQEPERFDQLEAAGYAVERYGDIYWHITERLGGHYMDMGCCEQIVNGNIKVKQGIPLRFYEDGLVCTDGHHEYEIEADVIIFATGFEGDMRAEVGRLFGKEVMERCDGFWGSDEEGELNGVFKPMERQRGLWFHAGTLGHARYMSRFIALCIKADVEGTPFEVFREKV